MAYPFHSFLTAASTISIIADSLDSKIEGYRQLPVLLRP
jgi:hypothetical protein